MKLAPFYYIGWILISLIFTAASFFAGYYKAQSEFSCDPFRIIKQEHEKTPPSIDSLLKK